MRFPGNHPKAISHRRLRNAVSTGQTSNTFTLGVLISSVRHYGPIQFVLGVVLAIQNGWRISDWHRSISAFCNHVQMIVRVSAKPQMVGVAAWRIVTLMQNAHIFRYRTKVKNPGCSMSGYQISVGFGSQFSVSPCAFGTSPEPARFSLMDLGPKALWESSIQSLRSKVLGGNLNHNQLVLPSGLLALAASSL